MNDTSPLNIGPARRRWLLRAVAALGVASVPVAIRQALARGVNPAAPGIYEMDGDVRVNGRPVVPGFLIRPGDVIETGPNSRAVFVVGKDAYLLRAESRLQTAGTEMFIDALRIITGRLLSVLGPGARRIHTRTATIGIRGTGIYVEAERQRTYVCTCYGTAELDSVFKPEERETVTTTHHDQPRYIYGESMPGIKMIEGAPVVNHTDDELIMLEALVGRTPPFDTTGEPRY
ncbi:MAG: hypothetical protein A3G25_20475 [Betaproteobacteria bacterium RIFCSPLOWO2_12_FULL_63_13]|nr:MAG: hypothetical protein A3H32_20745 [Betaproteobacteria bacterium RIFCSPLOWO2_02_FULL_63_19]OGA52415.1 MAG: hypothetical protein A3G25_20475 [Betaproteobacteria bacterium RIFCSPLOWO2_12_FULL_63_13]